MAVEVTLDSPLAKRLQEEVHNRVVESGWAGHDDSAFSEYIVLMLVNGKSQEQVATELSTDLLDISADDPSARDFARWLFERVDFLSHQPDPSAPSTDQAAAPQTQGFSADAEMQGTQDAPSETTGDAQDAQSGGAIPTGPKSMRDGPSRGRGGRMGMTGGTNRGAPRAPESGMHRVKGAASRINSHNRDAPRGPAPKGPRGNMRGNVNQGRMQNALQNSLNGMSGQDNGFSGFPSFSPEQMQALNWQQQAMVGLLTPEQQQVFTATLAQMQGVQGMPGMAPSPQAGRQNGHFNKRQIGGFKQGGDTDAMDLTSSFAGNNGSLPGQKPDPSTTICRYNLYCTKPECVFIHQSPAAPPDTSIDMSDTCSFGAACTNRKCVGKHPSPAKRAERAGNSQCRYWPNCMNSYCPFMHPSTPPCRNGADCKTPDCKFTHQTTECKFNPCLNPACPYKHVEGQKRGKFQDKVWVNPENGEAQQKGEAELVSERKFVDENTAEELVIPGSRTEETKMEEVKAEDVNVAS